MHFCRSLRQYDKPVRFTGKVEFDKFERRHFMDFVGNRACLKGKLSKLRKPGWVYETGGADPGNETAWTAAQLRQIADTLDELNR